MKFQFTFYFDRDMVRAKWFSYASASSASLVLGRIGIILNVRIEARNLTWHVQLERWLPSVIICLPALIFVLKFHMSAKLKRPLQHLATLCGEMA